MAQLDPNRYKRLTNSYRYGASDGIFLDIVTPGVVIVDNDTIIGRLALTQTSGHVLQSDGTDAELGAINTIISDLVSGAIDIDEDGVATVPKPRLQCVSETLTAATLTDGGAAVGTKSLSVAIPAGARFLFTTIDSIVGFAGDVSAVIQLGDGTDVDRYNTGTPNIFATAAAGVDMGAPSGTAFHAAAIANVVATVTSNADITPVLAGGGSCSLKFWYLEPV